MYLIHFAILNHSTLQETRETRTGIRIGTGGQSTKDGNGQHMQRNSQTLTCKNLVYLLVLHGSIVATYIHVVAYIIIIYLYTILTYILTHYCDCQTLCRELVI